MFEYVECLCFKYSIFTCMSCQLHNVLKIFLFLILSFFPTGKYKRWINTLLNVFQNLHFVNSFLFFVLVVDEIFWWIDLKTSIYWNYFWGLIFRWSLGTRGFMSPSQTRIVFQKNIKVVANESFLNIIFYGCHRACLKRI